MPFLPVQKQALIQRQRLTHQQIEANGHRSKLINTGDRIRIYEVFRG